MDEPLADEQLPPSTRSSEWLYEKYGAVTCVGSVGVWSDGICVTSAHSGRPSAMYAPCANGPSWQGQPKFVARPGAAGVGSGRWSTSSWTYSPTSPIQRSSVPGRNTRRNGLRSPYATIRLRSEDGSALE